MRALCHKKVELNKFVMNYLTAIIEPKLKHWNQSSTCENPMFFNRSLWMLIESVIGGAGQ